MTLRLIWILAQQNAPGRGHLVDITIKGWANQLYHILNRFRGLEAETDGGRTCDYESRGCTLVNPACKEADGGEGNLGDSEPDRLTCESCFHEKKVIDNRSNYTIQKHKTHRNEEGGLCAVHMLSK